MTSLREWVSRLWSTLHPRRRDEDLEEELRLHLELAMEEEARRSGATDNTRRVAALRVGGTSQAMEALRDQRGLPWLDELGRDVRYGWRALRRTPVFTSVAVLTLALAIGATTAIFSVVEAVMLRTLPIHDPTGVYFLAHGSVAQPGLGSNYPYFERLRALTKVFSGVTAYTRSALKVSTGDRVEITQGQFVSANFHDVLGVPIVLGRGFTSADDRPGAEALVAVISHGYWARTFGRSPDILGRTIVIGGKPVSIIGVTGPGFDGLEPGTRLDITLPLAARTFDVPHFLTMHDTWTSMPIVARLMPGVTETQAASAVETVFQQYMSEPENAWLRDGPFPDRFRASLLVPAGQGTRSLRGQYATSLHVLMAMVGVVLLIACVNVANLLIARGTARAKEVAVRMSIGASRLRLVRQFLTESVLLSLLGGGFGFVLARIGADAIVAIVGVGANPVLLDVQPNAMVLTFAITISTLTGILFGLAPALGATRLELTPALKAAGVTGPQRPRYWSTRQLLVAAQIGLCLALVTGAALLTRTLRNLETHDGGFDRTNVLMFSLDVRGTSFPAAQVPQFCNEMIDRLVQRVGGLTGSCSTSVPVDSRGNARPLEVPGSPPQPSDARVVFMNKVSPDYFRTLGINVAGGRIFDARDSQASQRVAIVNRAMARSFFGNESPIGRSIHFSKDEDNPMTIVGLVEDATQYSFRQEPLKTVYTPLTQLVEPESFVTVALRSRQDPSTLAASVRSEIRALSPDVVVDYVRTMEQQIEVALVRERLLATLSSGFGFLALVLSCIGLYGVVSYDVVRRTREIGIRMALGAQRGAVLRQILRGAVSLSFIGAVVGLALALAATGLLSSLLFGVTARDPLALASAVALIVATTLIASYLPARRASGVDPAVVLRSE